MTTENGIKNLGVKGRGDSERKGEGKRRRFKEAWNYDVIIR